VATGGAATDSANNATNAAQAFDRNSATKWLYAATTGWLKYDLGHTETVLRYTIISADVAGRDPKDWQFQGSNDGVGWTTLDAQSSQVFANRLQLKSYPVAGGGAYRWYRLNVTANNGDATSTAVAELGLFAAKP
ncbi:MAG: discoidin domain-containing protein, partial [Massilia sp.]